MASEDRKQMKRNGLSILLLFFIVIIAVIACAANVVYTTLEQIHFRSGTSLVPYIGSVAYVEEKLPASRGKIYDSQGVIVAQDEKTYDIICFMDPERIGVGNQVAYVDDINYAANMLAPILGVEPNYIYEILSNSKGLYQTELGAVGRNLSQAQRDQIEAIENLHGIGFRESYKRNYPYGSIFSPQLLGFAKSDDTGKLVGQLGLEAYLNDELTGTDGVHAYQASKKGYILPGMYDETTEPKQGYDVYLTLDTQIQEALNNAILRTIDKKAASRAWGAVVEIKTGKILAWDQYPSYNPNNITSEDVQVNFGSQLAYEPGSVMKPVIYSAAIELGTYDSNDTFDSSPYCYTDGAVRTYNGDQYGCIHNVSYREWGWIGVDYGLIYSSNVATATMLSQYVGIDNYGEFLKKYHFYEKVNSDGIAEIPGYTNYGLSPVDDITATYGQGSSLTMLQLLQAYTAMFGNGEELKPYFIDKIVDPTTDKVLYQGRRTVVGNPISESTAMKLQSILEKVVSDKEGTCRHYAAKTVQVMGKTGTSEIAVNGDYDMSESIISVMLGFPYEDPEYMLYFAYVSPETVYYNYEEKPIPDLVDRIMYLKNSKTHVDENGNVSTAYKVPNLRGEDTDDALEIIDEYTENVYVIGDGDRVIGQSPEALTDAYGDTKIFILTNGENLTVPDFNGWTRKNLVDYWLLSGMAITVDGYGVCFWQDTLPDMPYDKSKSILVKLGDIHRPIEELMGTDSRNEFIILNEENITQSNPPPEETTQEEPTEDPIENTEEEIQEEG